MVHFPKVKCYISFKSSTQLLEDRCYFPVNQSTRHKTPLIIHLLGFRMFAEQHEILNNESGMA